MMFVEEVSGMGLNAAMRDVKVRVLSEGTEEEGSHHGLHRSFAGLKTQQQLLKHQVRSLPLDQPFLTLVREI